MIYIGVIMSLYIKYILLFVMLIVLYTETSAIKYYGQFEAHLIGAKSCKGPKRKDCANTTITLTGATTVTCHIVVNQDVGAIKAKVLGTLGNEELMKMQVTKICDHIFFSPLFKTIFKMTNKCVLLKDDYTFSVNLEEIMNNYHGTNFMFGNWTYKALFYNDDCNFTCGIFKIAVTPKKKK